MRPENKSSYLKIEEPVVEEPVEKTIETKFTVEEGEPTIVEPEVEEDILDTIIEEPVEPEIEEEEYICPICGKTFSTERGLKQHITLVHKD